MNLLRASVRSMWMRLIGLFQPGRADNEFRAELESHVALHTDEGVRAGLAPAEARRRALIRLGGAEQIHQAHRERRTFPILESFLQDIHYGLRTLRRTPGFTLTAVLTLALGIGSSTAIFSLVNAVLIRSLPYGNPASLVYLFTPNPHLKIPAEVICPSYADFFDLKQQSKSYSDMTAFEQAQFTLTAQSAVQRIGAARVDERFFSTLESAPELGRAIDATDNQPGHDKVVVISHSLWQSMFAGSANVLHESIQLNSASYRIIGVMPPEFEYPFKSDLPYGNPQIKSTSLWVPLALTSKQKSEREPDADVTVARLQPGVTVRQAQAEMTGIMARLDRLHSVADLPPDWGALVENFTGISLGPVRPLMRMLLGAVLLVLLIACGNAANLMLARSSGCVHELGVRAALGAGRSRIMRQLLTESLLIGVAACSVGIALAWLFLRVLPYFDPGNIPRLNEASLDIRVLLFTLAASLLTSVLAGILPAWNASRLQLSEVLKSQGTRGQTSGHSRIQGALIVVQAAMVVVLLAAAGLLIRSYVNVMSVNTGFSPSTVTMSVWLDNRSSQPQKSSALYPRLLAKLNAIPGVSAAGAVSYLPLTNSESIGFIWVKGYANQKDQIAEGRSATAGYFPAMSIPLVKGRFFTESDDTGNAPVAMVNQSFANTYFAGRDPIGGQISGDEQQKSWRTVVGVVSDVRHTSLEEPPGPQMYVPSTGGSNIAIRSNLPPATVATEARTASKSMDPNLAITDIHTMGDLESIASARRRFQTSLLTAFAAIALVLALVGLYGLMAYSVNRRTQEVGIRMALGAQRIDVMLLVMQNAAWLLGLGLIAGLVCSWIATRALKGFLFEVGDHDPLTLFAVCSVLAVCGLIAAFVPARRAASIDPMQALRSE